MLNIFFDLDGTLTDPRDGIVNSIKYSLDRLDSKIPDDQTLEAWIGPPLKESFTALLGSDDNARIDRAIQLYRERFSDRGLYENSVYPGIEQPLQTLHNNGYALFVVTSKPRVFALRIIEYFALADYFVEIYGSELDGRLSDKTELIAHVLNREGINAGAAVMVGDRKHDILGARANQVKSLAVAWGYGSHQELEQAGPDKILQHPDELLTEFL